MAMASLAGAGLLPLGAPVIRAASCPLRPPAAPSRVHLGSPAAAAPARVRLRSGARLRLRCCAPPGRGSSPTGPPPWAPMSIEELIQLLGQTDLNPVVQLRYARESKKAAAAVKGAIAGLLLRPLLGLFDDLRKLKTVYDIEVFHIGLPVGAVMAGVAVHHLWKAAPSAFVDFVMHYAFYRLCVMAADVKRRGYSPDMIIRLKLFITVVMLFKGLVDEVAFLDYLIRFALFAIYSFSVSWEVTGLKKSTRYMLPIMLGSFNTPQECRDTLHEIDFGIDEDD